MTLLPPPNDVGVGVGIGVGGGDVAVVIVVGIAAVVFVANIVVAIVKLKKCNAREIMTLIKQLKKNPFTRARPD